MGIILKALGKGAAFVGKKAARVAVRHVAKKAVKKAVTATVLGTGVAICAIENKIHPHEIANVESTVVHKNRTKAIPKKPLFEMEKPKASNKKEAKIYEAISPHLKELNSTSKETYKSLSKLSKLKLSLLNKFKNYTLSLQKIKGLPEFLDIKMHYNVEVISFNMLSKLVEEKSQLFDDESLFVFIATHGFVDFDINDNELINRIHPFEKNFYNVDVKNIEKAKFFIKDIKRMENIYKSIQKVVKSLCSKLETCNERYVDLLKKLNSKISKTKEYKKVSKLVTSLFLSTILILDLLNTPLVRGDEVNTFELTDKMNRRMI